MNHSDHIRLIQNAIPKNSGGVWADFGSGSGAFTLALADIAGEDVEIYSIDKDVNRLAEQKEGFNNIFPATNIHYTTADFMQPLDIPPLDGLIAANSIHFYEDTASVIKHLISYLKPNGKFIIVEYNIDTGNTWVPYPFSFQTFQKITKQTGLHSPELLSTIPSGFLQEIYAARAILL